MSDTPLDMQPQHWQIVTAILGTELPDREVWAFGSRARQRAKPFSDLDLAVIGTQPLSLDVSGRLQEAFSQSDLPFKVDVVDWVTTTDVFRRIIARDHVVVQKPSGA